MRIPGLVDTGALLALLDSDDQWHSACVAVFSSFRLPLITSEAVLTELFYLVGEQEHERTAAWHLVRSGAVTVRPIDDGDLPDLDRLMKKYADRPMDFADATLVHLARRESISTVFTVDHNDFETYRIHGRKTFRILPERGAS